MKVLHFVESVVNTFPTIGQYGIQIGSVTYGNRAEANFYLNTYFTRDEIQAAFEGIRWKNQVYMSDN